MYLLAVLFVIPLTINKLLFLIESVLTLTKFLLKYYIGDKGELSGLSWQSLSILEHLIMIRRTGSLTLNAWDTICQQIKSMMPFKSVMFY